MPDQISKIAATNFSFFDIYTSARGAFPRIIEIALFAIQSLLILLFFIPEILRITSILILSQLSMNNDKNVNSNNTSRKYYIPDNCKALRDLHSDNIFHCLVPGNKTRLGKRGNTVFILFPRILFRYP